MMNNIMKMDMERKMRKFFDTLNHIDDDHLDIYRQIYINVQNTNERNNCALLHYNINSLFKAMNERGAESHYLAKDSRDLLKIIDIFDSKNSEEYYVLRKEYKEILGYCSDFLSQSGGSIIPSNFKKISLIEYEPIIYVKKIFDNNDDINNKQEYNQTPINSKKSMVQDIPPNLSHEEVQSDIEQPLINLISEGQIIGEKAKNDIMNYNALGNVRTLELTTKNIEKYVRKNPDYVKWCLKVNHFSDSYLKKSNYSKLLEDAFFYRDHSQRKPFNEMLGCLEMISLDYISIDKSFNNTQELMNAREKG